MNLMSDLLYSRILHWYVL